MSISVKDKVKVSFGYVKCQCPLEFYKQSAGLDLEMEEVVWTWSLKPSSRMKER